VIQRGSNDQQQPSQDREDDEAVGLQELAKVELLTGFRSRAGR
jgi:hypothetical protein